MVSWADDKQKGHDTGYRIVFPTWWKSSWKDVRLGVTEEAHMAVQEKRLIELLQAKRREDPEGFRAYMPDVAEMLPDQPSRRTRRRSPFGLTEQEVSYHRAGLSEALGRLSDGIIVEDEAIKGLRHCAHLIRDGSLQYTGESEVVNGGISHEMGHEVLRSLVRAAIGKSPGAYKAKTTIPVGEGGDVLERISVIMGVFLELDRDGRLVSISVDPGRLRKRRKLMAFVGASEDPEPDVALRHDDYLAMQDR